MSTIVGPEGFIIISVVGIIAFAIWSAVRRLRTKLSSDAKPTAWTYLNEFGGYIAVGLLLVIGLLVVVIGQLFS